MRSLGFAGVVWVAAAACASAQDVGALAQKLSQLSEGMERARNAQNPEAMADMILQWRELAPKLEGTLNAAFDKATAQLTEDVKGYKAKAADGSLAKNLSELYASLLGRAQESLKNMASVKAKLRATMEKMSKEVDEALKKPEVKAMLDLREAERKAQEALKSTDSALDRLKALNR